MNAYRLIIHRHGRLLGHFDTDVPAAREALADLLERLPASEGYRTELQVARGERRILESGPAGLRILGTETLYAPVTPDT